MNLPAKYQSAPVAELSEWGDLAKKTGVIPPTTSREQAMAIVQTGRELGLQPFQSLRSMNFINGRLTMSVQLQLALAKQGGVETPEGWLVEAPDSCTVTLKREKNVVTCTYTMEDAKKAGLTRAGGNYEKYGRQMLRWRAIGDALRLIAPDLVMGLLSPEEAATIDPLPSAPIVTEATSAPVSPSSGAAPEGAGVTTPAPAPHPSSKPDEEKGEAELRDDLGMFCTLIGAASNRTGGQVLFSMTDKGGKYGTEDVNTIRFTAKKTGGGEWSPLRALHSKAKAMWAALDKAQAEDDGLFAERPEGV